LKYKSKSFQISCDGGAATGKSTGAKLIANKYKLKFLSSGLLYRYAAFLILKNQPKNITNYLKNKFKSLKLKNLKSSSLQKPKVSEFSAEIAKIKKIRQILKKYQINFSKRYKNCCIEGRDISTNILPKSDVKFFFICNLNLAARRRYKELKKINPKIDLKGVKKALRVRNSLDKKRKNSPLLKHRDSVVIDTGKLGKQAMLVKMSKTVEKILENKYGNRTRN
jgi:cytidylate kinase|tara:strand:+ start:1481 stop:2149 length:669 start_codon:yes stop_codon:yes gene_type:complete